VTGLPDDRRVLGWLPGISLVFDLTTAFLIAVEECINSPW